MEIVKKIAINSLVAIGALALILALFIVPYHLYQDHQITHFNSQMLEAVRQAVIQSHPNLADDSPPSPEEDEPEVDTIP